MSTATRRGKFALAKVPGDFEVFHLGNERIRIVLTGDDGKKASIVTTPECAADFANAIWHCYDDAVGIAEPRRSFWAP